MLEIQNLDNRMLETYANLKTRGALFIHHPILAMMFFSHCSYEVESAFNKDFVLLNTGV